MRSCAEIFGIYFDNSDRFMGTNHPDYEKRFASNHREPAKLIEVEAPALFRKELRRSWQGESLQDHRPVGYRALPWKTSAKKMVEAAGVEPASENTSSQSTTCVSPFDSRGRLRTEPSAPPASPD